MANYKCHVTGSSSSRQLAPAKPPAYCANDQSKCVAGAKQMVAWNRKLPSTPPNRTDLSHCSISDLFTEKEGDNVVVPNGASPGYNQGMGWANGAQNDIYQ